MFDTHAAATLAKLNTYIHMQHYGVDDDLLWFQTMRRLGLLYGYASLRTHALRKVYDHSLEGCSGMNTTVEKCLSPTGGLRFGRQQRTTCILAHTASI